VPALPPYIHRSPSGNSSKPCYPSAALTIRSDATARAFPRGSSLREAGAGPSLRLRLPQDRRQDLLGEHAA
jgi:hypothetical protein